MRIKISPVASTAKVAKKTNSQTIHENAAPICSRCHSRPSQVFLEYCGEDLCSLCFCNLFEKRVRKANRDFLMLRRGDRIVVGISGGKDSAAMLHILDKMARKIGDITLIPVLIDEGIAGYREKAKKKAESLCKAHGYKLKVITFKGFANFTLDQMISKRNKSKDPALKGQKACTICGTFRKYLLNKAAIDLKANKVAIGHNADDVAQTFLMNLLRADSRGTAKFSPVTEDDSENGVIRRIRPLIYVPERECALYCEFERLPYHLGECPYSNEAFRGIVKDFLNNAEEKYPGTKFNVLSSYLGMREIIGTHAPHEEKASVRCKACGTKSMNELCKACELKKLLN